MEKPDWWRHMDCDLHIYPYDHAQPALLSMGCFNRCSFCPTAKHFQGNVYFGDPEIILPYYGGATVHFMDEDFFRNDMAVVLPLLDKLGIIWTAMSTFDSFAEVLSKYGDGMLYHYGLRCVEIGLENVDLMMKVKHDITTKMVEVYYLNMTCLPGETKQTIRNNREWMKDRSLKRPIHFNNGLWYAPGQFYYPYDTVRTDGIMLPSKYARTRPTYIPDTF